MEIMLPATIAIPPNLGIAFVCILLLSFGTSIAPILGAIFMANGVVKKESTNATKKVIHSVLYIS